MTNRVNQYRIQLLKTIAWSVFGFGMLYVVYSEYVSCVATGIVEARREGVGFAGDGALAPLGGMWDRLSFALPSGIPHGENESNSCWGGCLAKSWFVRY